MVPWTLLRLKPERPGEPVNTLPLMLTCVPVVPFQLPAMNTASKLPPDDVTPVMLLFVSVTRVGTAERVEHARARIRDDVVEQRDVRAEHVAVEMLRLDGEAVEGPAAGFEAEVGRGDAAVDDGLRTAHPVGADAGIGAKEGQLLSAVPSR